jgi:hypothetical protein
VRFAVTSVRLLFNNSEEANLGFEIALIGVAA